MSSQSTIEWTDTTWNPSTGCTKISPGCKHCYAETLSARLKRMGSKRYQREFEFTMHWDRIEEPLRWRKPRKIFVNSMSDLFHEAVDVAFVQRIFDVMGRASHHQYQVLTKRPDRMASVLNAMAKNGTYKPAEHIWLGTSVESEEYLERIDQLRTVPAAIRFLSCEPLLGPLQDLDLRGIHWVIVGGESGSHLWDEKARGKRALVEYSEGSWAARKDRCEWVRSIREQCSAQGIAFFFKQWGGNTPKAGGRALDGESWSAYPTLNRFRPGLLPATAS